MHHVKAQAGREVVVGIPGAMSLAQSACAPAHPVAQTKSSDARLLAPDHDADACKYRRMVDQPTMHPIVLPQMPRNLAQ